VLLAGAAEAPGHGQANAALLLGGGRPANRREALLHELVNEHLPARLRIGHPGLAGERERGGVSIRDQGAARAGLTAGLIALSGRASPLMARPLAPRGGASLIAARLAAVSLLAPPDGPSLIAVCSLAPPDGPSLIAVCSLAPPDGPSLLAVSLLTSPSRAGLIEAVALAAPVLFLDVALDLDVLGAVEAVELADAMEMPGDDVGAIGVEAVEAGDVDVALLALLDAALDLDVLGAVQAVHAIDVEAIGDAALNLDVLGAELAVALPATRWRCPATSRPSRGWNSPRASPCSPCSTCAAQGARHVRRHRARAAQSPW
jgi:hypothetical protein